MGTLEVLTCNCVYNTRMEIKGSDPFSPHFFFPFFYFILFFSFLVKLHLNLLPLAVTVTCFWKHVTIYASIRESSQEKKGKCCSASSCQRWTTPWNIFLVLCLVLFISLKWRGCHHFLRRLMYICQIIYCSKQTLLNHTHLGISLFL